MSAHFSRGIFQSATYVYSVGFAFTSDVCAPACPDQPTDNASAHPAAKAFHTLSFMVFLPPKVRPGLGWVFLAIEVYRGMSRRAQNLHKVAARRRGVPAARTSD